MVGYDEKFGKKNVLKKATNFEKIKKYKNF